MTPGQQAAIVASAQDWAKAQTAGSNQHRVKSATGPATLPDHLATVASAQRSLAQGFTEQEIADAVAKEANTSPEGNAGQDRQAARQAADAPAETGGSAPRAGANEGLTLAAQTAKDLKVLADRGQGVPPLRWAYGDTRAMHSA